MLIVGANYLRNRIVRCFLWPRRSVKNPRGCPGLRDVATSDTQDEGIQSDSPWLKRLGNANCSLEVS